jgi:hypothetical protein
MKEVLLILFGFLLGTMPPWLTRKHRLKTHWCALRADIDQCKEKAETLLRDQVMSPLYRLPLIAFKVSFPVLLADGAVNENEVRTIGRFFSWVEEINRGLDYAGEVVKAEDPQLLQQEFKRNCLKAKALIEHNDGAESLYDEVTRIVDSKVSLKWWKYMKSI